MSKKQAGKKKSSVPASGKTSRNWEEWRDDDDHTGDKLVKGVYETPQDYYDSEEYQTNQPVMRANQVEQALNFVRKLAEEHQVKIKSDGIVGEKVLIVLEAEQDQRRKIEAALRKDITAAGYGTVRIDITWG